MKIVDLDEIYNFVVQTFFIWRHLGAQIIEANFRLKFKFWYEYWTAHFQKIIINLYVFV